MSRSQQRWGVRRRLRIGGTIIVVALMLDQLTKAIVVATLAVGEDVRLGLGVRLVHALNTGVAFSMGRGRSGIIVPIVALTAVLMWVVRREFVRPDDDPDAPAPIVVVAFSLIIAGAMGNIIDRLFRGPGWGRGAVIDFVDVGWWPIFNVADACLVVGVVTMMVATVVGPRRPAPSESAPHNAAPPEHQEDHSVTSTTGEPTSR